MLKIIAMKTRIVQLSSGNQMIFFTNDLNNVCRLSERRTRFRRM